MLFEVLFELCLLDLLPLDLARILVEASLDGLLEGGRIGDSFSHGLPVSFLDFFGLFGADLFFSFSGLRDLILLGLLEPRRELVEALEGDLDFLAADSFLDFSGLRDLFLLGLLEADLDLDLDFSGLGDLLLPVLFD